MKPIITSFLLACSLLSFSVSAQDATTAPQRYYLKIDEVPNSLKLLPPPPETSNILFLYDKAQYEWGKLQRNTPRGAQAVKDAKLWPNGIAEVFSEAFGTEISKEKTPEIYKLIITMREDAGDLGTRHAKNHYMRVRPFMFFNEDSCTPEDQPGLAKNGSYPSGHTAIGWATALVLAEINPQRQDEILKRGYEIGQSRVICGCHFQSDVDAGRLTGSATVARLHADKAFAEQLAKAKKEFSSLVK